MGFLNIVRHYWAVISSVALGVITILSLIPLSELPVAPGSDKFHHLAAYGLVAFPIALRRHRFCWGLILLIILWGGLIELVQPLVNRYAEWADFTANSAGIMLAVALAFAINKAVNE